MTRIFTGQQGMSVMRLVVLSISAEQSAADLKDYNSARPRQNAYLNGLRGEVASNPSQAQLIIERTTLDSQYLKDIFIYFISHIPCP